MDPCDDVDGVRTADRLWAADGDDLGDPVRGISTDMGDLGAPLEPERVEERAQRRLVPPGCSPDQPPTVVIDDHGQVAMPLLVADLIDPDPAQTREPVHRRVDVSADPGDDRADRAPAIRISATTADFEHATASHAA